MSANLSVISLCVIIIISFLFTKLAQRTNIPSVLMLIILGFGLQEFMKIKGISYDFSNTLEVLGIIGLIMIVLEAALDLELRREKWIVIRNSFLVSLLSLLVSVPLVALIIQTFFQHIGWLPSLIYAVPFSIMSSAIVIPSVVNLSKYKKEFMIYESTFSDILGIMLFYFLIENVNCGGFGKVLFSLSVNLILTIIVSLAFSYLLILIMEKVRSNTRFFLFLSILVLIYSVSKIFHLSSLLIILVFGLMLRNHRNLPLGKRLKKYFKGEEIDRLFGSFKMITEETSFVIRTFFFIIFGITISIETLIRPEVWLLSLSFMVVLFLVRYILFLSVEKKNIFPQVFLAPRGLISILLFFGIPDNFKVPEFEEGALLLIILFTCLMMAVSLIIMRNKKDIA